MTTEALTGPELETLQKILKDPEIARALGPGRTFKEIAEQPEVARAMIQAWDDLLDKPVPTVDWDTRNEFNSP